MVTMFRQLLVFGVFADYGLIFVQNPPVGHARPKATVGVLYKACAQGLQTLEGSLSDEGGGDIHGRSTIGIPPAFRPRIPHLRVPYPMPPP
eukprot:4113015-Pyramimonas_sp.AAC.1